MTPDDREQLGRSSYRFRMVVPPSVAVAAAFLADGPADDVDLSLFGQFAGSWVLDCTEYDLDGSSTVRRGEWHFGYALGGRATTDVWILPGVEHGVSLRFPDPAAGAGVWRSTWVGPGRRRTHTFLASRVEGQIVLDGGDLRWTFSDIEVDAFRWSNQAQQPDGTWRLQQTFRVWRRS
ncbi:hypothetical protein [Micromonospora sp. DPT]|uniref:hypothetical protein n=1 Tax=Micromonospora sp. DPT TaxID=3142975 RepID=UPI0032086FDC